MKVFVTNPANGVMVSSRALTSASAIDVSIVDAAGAQITSFGGGTEYAEGESAPSPTGGMIMYWANATSVMRAVSNANPLPATVDGTVTANQGTSGTNQWPVGGGIAHDGIDSGNPVKIGGFASQVERTAVADNDRVDAWFDTKGRQVVALWHPNEMVPSTFSYSAASSATVIATPGAGQSLHICSLLVSNTSGTLTRVDFQDGAAGTVRVTSAAAASGGGFMWSPSRPWKLTANTGLAMQLSAGVTDIRTTCEYFTAP